MSVSAAGLFHPELVAIGKSDSNSRAIIFLVQAPEHFSLHAKEICYQKSSER